MLRSEFEKYTGYYPSDEDYKVIEEFYLAYEGDIRKFCESYKKNEGFVAEKIQREMDSKNQKEANNLNRAMEEKDVEINKLRKALEKEGEWKPYVDPYNFTQVDYEKLKGSDSTEELSDERAKGILCSWFGFIKEDIKIIRSVPVYEKNRHGMLRKVGEAERLPLYAATDWHYIRFDCRRMSWELVNDNLEAFSD